MNEDLQAILQQAEELGRLIRSTGIYRDYMAASGSLDADGEAVKLLEEYTALCRSIRERQEMADIIEKFEFENVETMTGLVSENETIMGYLRAQKNYLDLLTRIQKELTDDGFPGE